MNTPLRRLAAVVIVMFVALMGSATWVQYVQAPALNNDNRNVRTLYREFDHPRGPIVVGDKAVASSTPVDDSFGYLRSYADGPTYAPATGYFSVIYGASGIEKAMNTELNGTADSLFYSRVRDLITGKQPEGASVELTIVPAVQKAAWDALGSQTGAVVALDPRTGAILAMVSKPSYDPNQLASHDTAAVRQAWDTLNADPTHPLVNRAIAGDTYPPGSTFKIVTAAAALESGLTPDTPIAAPDQLPLPQSSAVLGNYGGESCSPTGAQTLADALRISCNTAFGQLGLNLGADALRKQAEAFGFDTPLQIPLRVTQSRFPPDGQIDPPQTAMSAIGQYDVRVTPLQVAMITATIADDGRRMAPYLVKAVRNQDLTVVDTTQPHSLGRAISSRTAAQLTAMMTEVVQSGTGTAAQIPGVAVAGKTGTAQTTSDAPPHAWFTAFAPADNPTVAVAVVVEHGGDLGNEATGGRIAAPIAKAVIQAALGARS
ncbi:penicillin-binding transpeptidase domain-containing protein [Isoptericola sp. b441]|uniref:Penicillin-binding transpeptidase domain-containing protein n=1 Tax=Actinotalea lenta TaxID=3064654 RepID=A0ABT9D5T9_9CELL|nr:MULTISPECIES: penicillin-binding transpeptidase domain-containing protein [unclassified Isoptericola]MDO8106160.1 penicillin-binding transpeptidase domain-containing protein [Isoptericola sp. b441]MDO8122121.1 penicillin-binding transpeptidase domain-containing protein [Isoptericola sp. b490]